MKTLPAGTGEKMQYMVHTSNDNTVRFVLSYPVLIDADRLRRAAYALIMSTDILHASFEPDAMCWRVHENVEADDFFGLCCTEGNAVQEAIRRSLRPVLPLNKCQLQCDLVQAPSASAIAVRISHLCVDGSDARYLLFKLAEAYERGDVTLKNGDRAPERLYHHLSFKARLSLLRSPSTGIRSPYPFPTSPPGEVRMAHLTIPAATLDRARKRAKVCGATANDLLLAACYAAYAATQGVDASAPMSVMSMMDLRRHCPNGDSDGLSNFSGSLPTSLPHGMPSSFLALLQEIARQTRREKSRPQAGLTGLPLIHWAVRTFPLPVLIKLAERVYASVGIGLTNLGNIEGSALALGGAAPTGGWFGGPLKRKPHMQISAASFDGACTLAVVGQYTQQDEQHIRLFLNRMEEAIRQFADAELASAPAI